MSVTDTDTTFEIAGLVLDDPSLSPRDRLVALIDYKKKVEASLSALMAKEGSGLLAELLDEHAPSILQAVAWTQYTPYFNDGEPCVFGVNDPKFVLLSADGEPLKDGDEDDRYDRLPGYETFYLHHMMDDEFIAKWMPKDFRDICEDPVVLAGLRKVLETFGNIPDELFLQAFGDHAKVILNLHTGKAQVDEYEHD